MAPDLYLDNNARTRCDERVLQAMLPFFGQVYGNPSASHQAGHATKNAVAQARGHVARLMKCAPEEVVFTSGGSEGDNTAIHSVMTAHQGRGHIICSACEHDAVLKPIEQYERMGCPVTRIEPGPCGFIHPQKVAAALRPDTKLVSIMGSNNETGAINPVEAIARIVRQHPVAAMMCDAVQCAGKVPLPDPRSGIDYMVISGHKFHGPPGIGALYVRSGAPYVPLIIGGGQESKRRAGTENVPAIVGIGQAAQMAMEQTPQEHAELAQTRDGIQHRLEQMFGPKCMVLCKSANRVPGTLLVAFRGVNGRELQAFLAQHDIAVGTGSACSCLKEFKPSATVQAMHIPRDYAMGTIRISLSRFHTPRYGFTQNLLEPFYGLLAQFCQ